MCFFLRRCNDALGASHLLGQSVAFFTGTRGGDLMSRLLNDVSAVQTVVGDIHDLKASDIPDCELFTASFPG